MEFSNYQVKKDPKLTGTLGRDRIDDIGRASRDGHGQNDETTVNLNGGTLFWAKPMWPPFFAASRVYERVRLHSDDELYVLIPGFDHGNLVAIAGRKAGDGW